MLNPKSPDRNPAKGSKFEADESLDAGTEDDDDGSYDHGSLSDGCTEDEELDSADEDEDEEEEEDEDDYGLDDSYEADDPSGKSPQAPTDNIFRFRGMRDELDDAFEGAQKMQDQLETVSLEYFPILFFWILCVFLKKHGEFKTNLRWRVQTLELRLYVLHPGIPRLAPNLNLHPIPTTENGQPKVQNSANLQSNQPSIPSPPPRCSDKTITKSLGYPTGKGRA
jgi:hypothetical protein